jgi:AraC-like DNA-binding protein
MRIYREITPVREDDVFIIRDYHNPKFEYPIHNHPELELNLVINCAGNRIVGDSVAKYSLKDLVLIGSDVYHRWDDDDLDYDNRPGPPLVITIQFDKNLFDAKMLSKKAFYAIRLLLDQSVRGIQFHGETLEQSIELLQTIVQAGEFEKVLGFLQLMQLLATSKERSFLASTGFSSKPEHSKSQRINDVYEYILNNFNKKIGLKDVAAIANMSDSAFSHFFKKSTNKSFTQFVIDLRIGHACKLLLESQDTISQICYNCGFSNVSNFNRLFKKNKGLSPYNYRKQFDSEGYESDHKFQLIKAS